VRTSSEYDEVVPPVGDATHEEVRRRVDCLDRYAGGDSELHQREALRLGAGEADDVDVLRGPVRGKPRRCSSVADQKPLALETIRDERDEVVDTSAVESHGHGGSVTEMPTAWQILRDGGLPLAIDGTGTRRAPSELAAAIRLAVAEGPQGRDAEALAAYVFAWHHRWARSFADELGDAAGPVLGWARGAVVDDNRYLKLRRISIERLATIL
jgi:hypothetical protein